MKRMRIALAGNANVGKSSLFNYLTGLRQHTGNWPGKTVEKKEGALNFRGTQMDIVDLPGIYSLSTVSLEEKISREYILGQKPDVVINVVDASILERNLFFTLQLFELGAPVVIALNMVDTARKKGAEVDAKKLSLLLGVPVVPIVATTGDNVAKLMREALRSGRGKKQKPLVVSYRKPMENEVRKMAGEIKSLGTGYPPRWVAVKLLEKDRDISGIVGELSPKTLEKAEKVRKRIEERCGQESPVAVSSERYSVAERIARECIRLREAEVPLRQKLDQVLLHRYAGYFFLAAVAGLFFYSIFSIGDAASGLLLEALSGFRSGAEAALGEGVMQEMLLEGALEGIIAGISIALPYLIPFYILLAVLEDTGYLARMAFLMDALMHKIGLHGKAFIPIILAYGCNVPGCISCRILETQRARLLTAFVVTLVPCAAVSVVVMGLVASFVGIEWALILYLLNLAVIVVLGRLGCRALPGEPVGLIMEMPGYRLPAIKNVLLEAWRELRSFVFMAFPIIIISTILIKAMELMGWLGPVSALLSPITVGWLGLPSVVGITLIFGILRKELALIMLAALLGTEAFDAVLTPVQMITYAVVTMYYVPCAATIAALNKAHGWKAAFGISAFEIVFAIVLAGIVMRVLEAGAFFA